jgi:ElaB/YqjD/DUF883 family membrane-anchored ribosome-binding protein
MNGKSEKQRSSASRSRASGSNAAGSTAAGSKLSGSRARTAGKQSAPRGKQAVRTAATNTMSRASNLAYQATDTVLQAASDSASSISHQVTDMLDRQVVNGADMIHQVASSTRLAADDMTERMPQVAGMVRSVADRIDGYADGMRDKTVDQMVASAADFTRRQPVAVFGLAALAGFLVLRAFGNAPMASENQVSPTRRRSRANG